MIHTKAMLITDINRLVWIVAFILLLMLCTELVRIRLRLAGSRGISISIILIDGLIALIQLSILTTGSLVLLFVTDIHFPNWYVIAVGVGWLISAATTLVRLNQWNNVPRKKED